MAEPDLLITAGFSDAKLAQEAQKVVAKYKQMGDAAEKAFKDSTGAVAESQALKAHMRELDQLSRKYDPLYVATKKYERAVKDLDRAFDLGRIDAKKYADEMRSLNAEMARSSGVIQDTATKTRGFGGNLSNIGFQVGDFATQVGAGTSATQALGQQLPQLLGGFGAVGAVAGAAAAILIPLAGALWGAGEEAQTLDEQLEALEKSTGAMTAAAEAAATPIDELREKYGDLADEVDRANQSMLAVTAAAAKRDALAAARRLGGELGSDLPNMGAYLGPNGNVMPGYERPRAQLEAQAAETLGKKLGATADEATRLVTAISQLGRGGTLDDLIVEGAELQGALSAITAETGDQQSALAAMATQVGSLMTQATAQVEASADVVTTRQQEVISKYAETTTKLKELAAERAIAVEASKSADKAIADGAKEAIRNIDRQIAKVKELARASDDMMERGAFWSGPYQAPPDSRGSAFSTTREMISGFEGGYRAEPYWDVNKYRAGYGSETYVTADGVTKAVVAGVRVSKEDADRDLDQRILKYFDEQRRVVGPAWISFTDSQKAALASIQHNYGSIPDRLKPALSTGDAQTIATAIAGLAMDYTRTEKRDGTPVNYNRRMKEAAAFGDTSAQGERNQQTARQLRDEIAERERQLKAVKDYGETLAKNLVTVEQDAELTRQRADALRQIEALGLNERDKAAAVAEINGEYEKQRLILTLIEDAKRRQVDLDMLMTGSTMTYAQAIAALGDAAKAKVIADQQQAEALDAVAERQQFMAQVQDDLKNGLLDSIVAGESFSDVLANVADMLAKAALQAALFNEGPFASGGGGSFLGALFKTGIGSIFGGARAMGGPVNANTPYLVGERGPEIIVPRSAGQVIPNHNLGGTTFAPQTSIIVQGSADEGTLALMQRELDARDRRLMRMLPSQVKNINRDPLRS